MREVFENDVRGEYMKEKLKKAEKIFNKLTRKKYIHESVLFLENSNGDFSYCLEYGGKKIDTPFLAASITKLFTTACIYMLKEQGALSFSDKISKHLEEEIVSHLHIYKGQDYSKQLTISTLLCQTTGLRDVNDEGSNRSKKRVIDKDKQIDFNETLIETKKVEPYFIPNLGGRAHYTNINFDILGKIIEQVTNLRLAKAYKKFIFDPLKLNDTYLPIDENDFVPNVYYKEHLFHRPKAVRSSWASGGCISTARDLMIFTKAFFNGELFNKAIFDEFTVINRLQFAMYPIHYSTGYMNIPLSGFSTFFLGTGDLIGHSGSTGSFAFYYPEQDLFLIGDVNQMANPAIPIRLVMQLAMALK